MHTHHWRLEGMGEAASGACACGATRTFTGGAPVGYRWSDYDHEMRIAQRKPDPLDGLRRRSVGWSDGLAR